MKPAEIYLQQSNKIKEELTAENLKYYEDLRGYTVFGSLTHDQTELEEQLLTIVTDLLAAQKDGLSAESYFGKNPQESANALLQQLSKSSFRARLSIVGMIIGITWVCLFIVDVSQNNILSINWLTYLSEGVFALGMIFGLFKFFQKMVYQKNRWLKKPKIQFFILWLGMVLWMGGSLLMVFFMPKFYPLAIAFPLDIILILIFMAGALGIGIRVKEKVFIPLIFLFEMMALVGGLQRLSLDGFIGSVPISLNLAIIIVADFIYFIWTLLAIKKAKLKN